MPIDSSGNHRAMLSALVCSVLLLTAGGCGGDGSTSPTTTSWSEEQIRDQIVESNLNHPAYPTQGRLKRWNIPIQVNTNGIARAEEAVARYETLTGGLISFTRVEGTPSRGIVFIEGGASNPDGTQTSCGNVTDTPAPSPFFHPQVDSSGALSGVAYIHLGSAACDDAKEGDYRSAIAEHELGHALGIQGHFDGFTGDEGLRNPNMFNVIYNMYNNPIGTTAQDLRIAIVRVGG